MFILSFFFYNLLLERKYMDDFNLLIKKLNNSIEKIESQTDNIIALEEKKDLLEDQKKDLIKESIKIKHKLEKLLQKFNS